MTVTREHMIPVEGARLHAIEILDAPVTNEKKTDLLYIPGLCGTACESTELLKAFGAYRKIAVSMRGRGKSVAGEYASYSTEVHARDLLKVVRYFGMNDYGLIAYSLSTLYVLAAFSEKDFVKPKKLVLCDFPAKEKKMNEDWAESMDAVFGAKGAGKITKSALSGIARDSRDRHFTKELSPIDCQVLLMVAGGSGAVPGMLSGEDLLIYQQNVKNLKTELFSNSGHFFRDTEREKFLSSVNTFI